MKLAFLPCALGVLTIGLSASAQEAVGSSAARSASAPSHPSPGSNHASESAVDQAPESTEKGTEEGTASASPPPSGVASPAYYRYRGMSDETLAYEYERTTLGGPIALTVVGGVVSGLAFPTFLVSSIGAVACHYGNQDTNPDCTPFDALVVGSGITTAVFGALTVVGVIWLDQRSRKRSEIKNELWRREAERSSLELRLRPTWGGSMLTLAGRF